MNFEYAVGNSWEYIGMELIVFYKGSRDWDQPMKIVSSI
jgi:hypothetical protein